MRDYANNREMKVKFEIQNMFTSGNRVTYGRVSTFCPILGENDLINSVDKMLVTAQKIEDAMNKVRKVDFSVFYRGVVFSDPDKGNQSRGDHERGTSEYYFDAERWNKSYDVAGNSGGQT